MLVEVLGVAKGLVEALGFEDSHMETSHWMQEMQEYNSKKEYPTASPFHHKYSTYFNSDVASKHRGKICIINASEALAGSARKSRNSILLTQ